MSFATLEIRQDTASGTVLWGFTNTVWNGVFATNLERATREG